jgi:hypothetical protein
MGGFDINSADPSGSTIRVGYDGQGIQEGYVIKQWLYYELNTVLDIIKDPVKIAMIFKGRSVRAGYVAHPLYIHA